MKKRTRRVVSVGVAAILAMSTLSAMPAAAIISQDQTTNGGSPYNLVLQGTENGEKTFQVASGEAATIPVGIYIDGEDWPDDNFIDRASMSWATTVGATLADGGEIADLTNGGDIYYSNTMDISEYLDEQTTDVNGASVTYKCPLYCLATATERRGSYIYNDASLASATTKECAVDTHFGHQIQYVDDTHVQFYGEYFENAEAYSQGESAKTKKMFVCEVQEDDKGYYIEYTYTRQGVNVDANYYDVTNKQYLPYWTTDQSRMIPQTATVGFNADGSDQIGDALIVPGSNNYYLWLCAADDTSFLGGDSMALPFVTFDVEIPAGTPDGTYYVQIASQDYDANICALNTASDFDTIKSEMWQNGQLTGHADNVTMLGGSGKSDDYGLPQDESLDTCYITVIVGEGSAETTTTTESTTESTTTTTEEESLPDNAILWDISEEEGTPGTGGSDDEYVTISVNVTNGIESANGWTITYQFPDATAALLRDDLAELQVVRGGAYTGSGQIGGSNVENFLAGEADFLTVVGAASSPMSYGGDGTALTSLNFYIPTADTVTSIAAQYGLELQTDDQGRTYYEFPFTFAARDFVNPGTTLQGNTVIEMDRKGFTYLSSSNTEMFDGSGTTGAVVLRDGSLKVIMGEAETTDRDVTWKLEEATASPGELFTYHVQITNPVDGICGYTGTLMLPDAANALLRSDGTDLVVNPMSGVYGGTGGSNYENFLAGEADFITFVGMNATPMSPNDTDNIASLEFYIPDEDTVAQIAAQYGIELQTADDGTQYYEFPMTWADRDFVNMGYTMQGDTQIEMPRKGFTYLSSSLQEIFDRVELEDGYLRITVSADHTTATTAETTTTTTTEAEATTTTTTTESSAGPTTESTTQTTGRTTATTERTTARTTTTTRRAQVKLNDNTGYYFSVDTRTFASMMSDLVTVTGGSVNNVTFEYNGAEVARPAAVYNAVGEAYCAVDLDVMYNGASTGNAYTVYIGVKGDTNLDAKVDVSDASATLEYYAAEAMGEASSYTFTGALGLNADLEKLIYFLSDIDTESTAGVNGDDGSISVSDARYILTYYAYASSGSPQTWPEVCPDLKSLAGSIWAS